MFKTSLVNFYMHYISISLHCENGCSYGMLRDLSTESYAESLQL